MKATTTLCCTIKLSFESIITSAVRVAKADPIMEFDMNSH